MADLYDESLSARMTPERELDEAPSGNFSLSSWFVGVLLLCLGLATCSQWEYAGRVSDLPRSERAAVASLERLCDVPLSRPFT
jgi:hypothetical protein